MRDRFINHAMLGLLLLCQLSVCLDFVPQFDDLIATNGRFYLSTLSGEVLCLSGIRGQPLAAVGNVVVAAGKIKEQTP